MTSQPTSRPRRVLGLRGTAALVMLSTFVSAITLGVAAIITARVLGPDGRGVFAINITLATFTMLIGGAGVGLAARRLLVVNDQEQGVGLRAFLFVKSRLVVAQLAISVVTAAFVLPLLGATQSASQQAAFVAYATVMVGASLSRDSLYAVGRSNQAAAAYAGASVVQLLLIALLAIIGYESVAGYIWAFAIGASVEYAVSSGLLRRAGHDRQEPQAPGQVSRLLRAGPPALALILAQTAVLRGDRLIVAALTNPTDVGLYTVAATATEFLAIGAFALAQVAFHPVASGDIPNLRLRRLQQQALLATALGAALLIAIAPWFISLLFGKEFMAAVPLMRVLALAVLPYASYQMDIYYLAAAGRAGRAAVASVIGVVIMIVGDLLMIHWLGLVGAAWATLIAYCFAAAIVRLSAVQLQRATT